MRYLVLLAFLAVTALAAQAQHEPGAAEPGHEAARDAAPLEAPRQWTHPPVEARGVWLTAREMLAGREQLQRKLDAFQRANFNTVLIDSWFRGYVAYPGGEIVPQYPQLDGEDILTWLIEQCHQRGLRAELWYEYGFYCYHTTNAEQDRSMGPLLDAHPELAAVDSRGRRFLRNPEWGDYYSLCPSNPRSHELLSAIIVESLRRHPAADGVNLDRIRYPTADYCYCSYCTEHFEKETGIPLRVFEEGSREAAIWLDWKRERTAVAVERIQRDVHALRPGLPITSYVVGPHEMDSRAQGWDLWAERGLVDAVAVSMYGHDIRAAAEQALQRLGGDSSRLICAISAERPIEALLRNIHLARQHTRLGQFIWFSDAVMDDVEALAEGPYARPAEYPLGNDQ